MKLRRKYFHVLSAGVWSSNIGGSILATRKGTSTHAWSRTHAHHGRVAPSQLCTPTRTAFIHKSSLGKLCAVGNPCTPRRSQRYSRVRRYKESKSQSGTSHLCSPFVFLYCLLYHVSMEEYNCQKKIMTHFKTTLQ